MTPPYSVAKRTTRSLNLVAEEGIEVFRICGNVGWKENEEITTEISRSEVLDASRSEQGEGLWGVCCKKRARLWLKLEDVGSHVLKTNQNLRSNPIHPSQRIVKL